MLAYKILMHCASRFFCTQICYANKLKKKKQLPNLNSHYFSTFRIDLVLLFSLTLLPDMFSFLLTFTPRSEAVWKGLHFWRSVLKRVMKFFIMHLWQCQNQDAHIRSQKILFLITRWVMPSTMIANKSR